jgi:polar amino acid transport system ATP-binding protein
MSLPSPLPGHADRHHEMNFARRSADRIVFLDEGKIVETAGPEAFFAAPRSTRDAQLSCQPPRTSATAS